MTLRYKLLICFHQCTCCHTEVQVADRTCYLTQSWCTDTGPTSPSTDPISQAPGSATTRVSVLKAEVTGMTQTGTAGFDPRISRSRGGRLTTRPPRGSQWSIQGRHTTQVNSQVGTLRVRTATLPEGSHSGAYIADIKHVNSQVGTLGIRTCTLSLKVKVDVESTCDRR